MSSNCRTFQSEPPNSNQNKWLAPDKQSLYIYSYPAIASWKIGLAQYVPLNILQYAQPPLQQIAHQQQTHIAQELPWDKRGGNVKERKEENVSKRKAMYRAMQYTLPNYLNIIYRFFHFHAFVFISVYWCVILRIISVAIMGFQLFIHS